ncbi:flagellar basal body-associated FliL family protein [Sphingomonas sp. AOB5]|uniref:flagellar basal body-associated FliL family protein n=1 Tax=Sphingomonas sp. AOB5 TaxID=3034017 RepID=UPI0023F65756|nr:flagellar basal body-associated FliL family protein [Sphingomonas sp. AOB5]MDF7777759.1 flagellar basal body-associated FliL family protein [Sphingomonas sp. AOB5]
MSDDVVPQPPKKKGKGKLILFVGLPLLLAAGGGGGYYAYSSGMLSAAPHGEEASGPKLVDKADEKRAGSKGSEGGHGEESSSESGGGMAPPKGEGGDKYASNYYQFEKEFTSNLMDSVHFMQVGIAISTPYDDTVIEGIKTHEIAIRSAVLMALGQTSEEDVFTAEGKTRIQKRLVDAINAVLKQKEGFGGVSNVYFTNFIVQ